MSAGDSFSTSGAPAHVLASLAIAQQYVVLALQLAAPFLQGQSVEKGAAIGSVVVAGLGILTQAIQQQSDIADVDMATLDAQEVLILAADAKAQADAAARQQGQVG